MKPADASPPPPPPPPETLRVRAWRFGRALIVGSGATLTDFSIFTTLVRAADIAPTSARLPALLAGATCQFFGSRGFTFRARAGRLERQLGVFVVAEGVTLALNFSVFKLLSSKLGFLPPELLGLLGTGLVFLVFAYPVRRLIVFKLPHKTA